MTTLSSGKLLWILFPMDLTTAKALACSPKCFADPQNPPKHSYSIWVQKVFPQLKDSEFYGRSIQLVEQKPGDTLYVPSDWSHVRIAVEESVFVEETFLTEDSLEDLSYTWREQEIHALKKNLMTNDNYRRQKRRFEASLKQVQKAKTSRARKSGKK